MPDSKLFNTKWFVILLILSAFILMYHFFKQFHVKAKYEGFTQASPFVLKQNNDIYDEYYSEVYDDIYKPELRIDYEYKSIIDMTQPSINNSVFLDIGSGTGNLVNKLIENGFQATGIDKSQAMVKTSQEKFPNIDIKQGCVFNSMSYNRNSFTHITCMDFTIYHLDNKLLFLQNCYQWLMPNGYFIVHLADKNKYNPIVPAANPILLENPQQYSNKRITDSAVDFIGFQYKNSCNCKANNDTVVIKETFKDATSCNIRQNELTLHMEELKTILLMIQKCGFIAQGNVQMNNDKHQYIYVFEKQL